MRQKQIIEEMALLAEKLGLNIKFDEFDGRGGWCRVKDSQRIIINQRLGPQEQIRILSQILAGHQIEEQSMVPKIRQLIEEAREERQPALDISDKTSSADTKPEE